MRVLAASFVDDTRAREARAKLLAELALEAHQVGVEILAQPSGEVAAPAVLAGQFDEELVNAARQVLERYGGTVMLDIDANETNA
jgi:predicted SpoU family rRNA methylase